MNDDPERLHLEKKYYLEAMVYFHSGQRLFDLIFWMLMLSIFANITLCLLVGASFIFSSGLLVQILSAFQK